ISHTNQPDQFFFPCLHRGQPFLPLITGNGVNLFADRLSNQERTTAALLQQAFRIKDDIIANLRGSHGYYQGQGLARRLLENHIQTITNIVKQLSKDIVVLEEQIRARDGVSAGTSFAVQSLDVKHVAGIGDLRGRVARCDANISKLSGDVSVTGREIQRLEKEIQTSRSTVEAHIRDLEMQVSQLFSKMEASLSQQSSKIKAAQEKQQHGLLNLDLRVVGVLDNLRDQIESQRKWAETQLQRSEQEQAQRLDQLLNMLQCCLKKGENLAEEKKSWLNIQNVRTPSK
uniref:Family with sequence similarity 81 member B n=1 Tax=Latimeria chalumnae TaxID=7897 RepID=H3ASS9_LATCH